MSELIAACAAITPRGRMPFGLQSSYQERVDEQRKNVRTLVQGDARVCRNVFGNAWKSAFKHKAAEELASRTGMSVRAAAYEISGEREPSALSIHVFVEECLDEWRVKNRK